MVLHKYQGDMQHWLPKLHEKYGGVVRLAPNEVSYIDARGWKDIMFSCYEMLNATGLD